MNRLVIVMINAEMAFYIDLNYIFTVCIDCFSMRSSGLKNRDSYFWQIMRTNFHPENIENH